MYSDFRPPKSPRYQRSSEDSSYYSRRSSCEEEKKTSDEDKIVSSHPSSNERGLSTPEPVKNESRSSPYQEEIERSCVGDKMEKSSNCESRASPVGFMVNGHEGHETAKEEDDQSEEAQAVDDIAMSPISYDREDPMTLMDLPDDLLNLPISACGPHDDPAAS